MAEVTKKFTSNESTSSSQSLTVTLPKLKDITSITVNTGTVTYKVDPSDEEKVILTLRGGSHSRVYDGTYWVPPSSRTEDTTRSSTEREYYTASGDDTTYTWSGPYYEDVVSAPGSVSYNSGGYTGTLSWTGSRLTGSSTDLPLPPTSEGYYVGERHTTRTLTHSNSYSGTVTRDGYWAGSNTYYYQYNITVTYEEQGFEWIVKIDNKLRTTTDGWVKVDGVLRKIESAHTKIDVVLKEV